MISSISSHYFVTTYISQHMACQSYELIGRLVVDRDWWTGTVVRWQSWQRIHQQHHRI
jgi:hypothetical protein